MPKLVADTTRKPPAARLTAGRTCAKRMKALSLLLVAPAERIQYGVPRSGVYRRFRTVPPVFDTKPSERRYPRDWHLHVTFVDGAPVPAFLIITLRKQLGCRQFAIHASGG